MRLAESFGLVVLTLASVLGSTNGLGAELPVPQTAKPMGISDMFSRKSALQKVLERGDDPKVDLAHLLHGLDETTVKTKIEAEAICNSLKAPACGSRNRQTHHHSPARGLDRIVPRGGYEGGVQRFDRQGNPRALSYL